MYIEIEHKLVFKYQSARDFLLEYEQKQSYTSNGVKFSCI